MMGLFQIYLQIIKEKLQLWLHTLKSFILKQDKGNSPFTDSKLTYEIVITRFFIKNMNPGANELKTHFVSF